MPSDYARRGRPRGSGLDDRVQLERIALLLEADPALRPTTAIKALGITDPSTIRRLRDKLRADPPGIVPARGDVWPAAEPHTSGAFEAGPVNTSNPGSLVGAQSAGGVEIAPATAPDAQFTWFTQWCALGLSAVSSTVEAQLAVMDDLLGVPQVASALRQQLLFNEVAKALCPKRSDIRSTLH